ncbi:MAG: type II secretion system GspH family protein [Patescibacteria group bacterium]|nr:type II secretion system GspH family protein [Patescibacteria group bacterium]
MENNQIKLITSQNIVHFTRGFTLVELLVVIALIAVLAVAVILTLNPAELLKQGRDSTRISDLANINSALSYYVSDTTTWTGLLDRCYTHVTGLTTCTNRFSSTSLLAVVTSSQAVNGTGWLPINLNLISFRSPIPRYPIDPTPSSTIYYYAFRPSTTYGFYEINAILESGKYLPQAQSDGGNSTSVFEMGTDLNL